MESTGGAHTIKTGRTQDQSQHEQSPHHTHTMADYRGSNSAPWGKPVVGGIMGSPYQAPVHHLRDHQGNLVLDESGNPQLDHSRYV